MDLSLPHHLIKQTTDKSKTMKKVLFILFALLFTFNVQAQNWSLTGNAGTTATQYLGTTDAKDLRLNTSGVNRMTINSSGNTGFNIAPESYSKVFSNMILPTVIGQNFFYSAVKGRMTSGTTTRSHGYLGVYTTQSLSLGGLPTTMNYMGVLGVNESGSANGVGVVGWNKNSSGGGIQYGIYGLANGAVTLGAVTDKNVGVYGRATGNLGNIGVWGVATGGADFAGYFTGRSHFSDKMGIGTESPTAMLTVNAPANTALLALNSANANKFTVSSLGRVGIGTAAPATLLHLNGTAELARFNAASPYFTFHNNNVEKAWMGCDAGNLNIGTVGTNATGNIYFYTNTGPRMAVFANGKVGIGTLTNSIDAALHVDHSGITKAVFGAGGTGVSILGSYPGIAFNSYYTNAFKAMQTGYGFDITCSPVDGQLAFRTHNSAAANATQTIATRMTVNNDGRVVIGNIAPATNYLLSVDGRIMCEELKVQNSGNWPDYVFTDDYKLRSLEEVENHINEKGFLPGMPSAEEAQSNGVSVGDMQKKLLEKVEELTLYVISLEKKVKSLESK